MAIPFSITNCFNETTKSTSTSTLDTLYTISNSENNTISLYKSYSDAKIEYNKISNNSFSSLFDCLIFKKTNNKIIKNNLIEYLCDDILLYLFNYLDDIDLKLLSICNNRLNKKIINYPAYIESQYLSGYDS